MLRYRRACGEDGQLQTQKSDAYAAQATEEVLAALGSDAGQGLSSAAAAERLDADITADVRRVRRERDGLAERLADMDKKSVG